MSQQVAKEPLGSLVSVLDAVRSGRARTRPELGQLLGYGRSVVAQRVTQLIDAGLVEDRALGPSTGGRAPQQLGMAAHSGHILVAALGGRGLSVGIADLSGELLALEDERHDVSVGPQATLDRIEHLLDKLLAGRPLDSPPLWGLGIGIPGPVEFATGRAIAPPSMPGWDGYPVRARLATKYQVPVWVDNDVNLMALGEIRTGLAQGVGDVLCIKMGTGIGCGIICDGQLYRGAQGVAGDISHIPTSVDSDVICRCGNAGCLEALASGYALSLEAMARRSHSRFLSERFSANGELLAVDITDAAAHGDPLAVELLTRAGRLVGDALARLVNFHNPSLIIIGGGLATDLVLASIRQAVYQRSLPLATRDLRLLRSPVDSQICLRGAASLVLDELFSPACLVHWIDDGPPTGRPSLADLSAVAA